MDMAILISHLYMIHSQTYSKGFSKSTTRNNITLYCIAFLIYNDGIINNNVF